MAGSKSPWGKKPGSGESGSGEGPDAESGESSDDDGKERGPRNPWLPGRGNGGSKDQPRRSASIEDIFKNRGPEGPRRGGGPGGGPGFNFPSGPGGKSLFPWLIGGVVAIGLLSSMIHQVGPKEQGVVTTVGKYSRTLGPGLNFTAPWPIQDVNVENVSQVRLVRIPDGTPEKLILTGDQNLVDLSYLIRYNIKDLKQYKFQLAEPKETVKEVAEAAMRASVAEQTLDDTFSGAGRADIEQRVRNRMQTILDGYRAGVAVQGVEIDKTDPPERVVEAFKDVSAAEQDADAARNRARAWAEQVLARAQGDAAAFDKVYEEYRLAPTVTKRRMYYETMEQVLSETDKTVVEAPGVTPYLPLPEVKRRAAQQPAETGGQ